MRRRFFFFIRYINKVKFYEFKWYVVNYIKFRIQFCLVFKDFLLYYVIFIISGLKVMIMSVIKVQYSKQFKIINDGKIEKGFFKKGFFYKVFGRQVRLDKRIEGNFFRGIRGIQMRNQKKF